jgi:WD40 repeat protein
VALEEGVPVVEVTDAHHSRLAWALSASLALALAGLAALAAIHFRETSIQPATVRFQIPPPDGASLAIDLALSPDGRHLAFTASPKGASPVLWVRALDSLEARVLRGTEYARFPVWSPDGRFQWCAYPDGAPE